ncbi:hypothetical protein M0P65_00880 [Candidatus Gracilibacteria bacterium]|nr:hypothetical protein [Candidatus Gracilibacteria bacterium]
MTIAAKSLNETLIGLNKEIDEIRTQNEPSRFLRKEVNGNHISYSQVSYDKIYEKFPDIPVTIGDLHRKMDELISLKEGTKGGEQLKYMMKNFIERINDGYDCESSLINAIHRINGAFKADILDAYEAYLVGNLGELEVTLGKYISIQKGNTDLLDEYYKAFDKTMNELIKKEMDKIKSVFGFKKGVISKTGKKVKRNILDIILKPSKI